MEREWAIDKGYNYELAEGNHIWIAFKVSKSNTLVPSHYFYDKEILNTGANVSVEVVENGYILTHGKSKYIESQEWNLTERLKAITHKTERITKPFKASDWKEDELSADIIKINAEYKDELKRNA